MVDFVSYRPYYFGKDLLSRRRSNPVLVTQGDITSGRVRKPHP